MNTSNSSHIIEAIDEQIARLRQARDLIAGERAVRNTTKKVQEGAAGTVKKRRSLTPEARARIVAAQKARWAKARKAAGKA